MHIQAAPRSLKQKHGVQGSARAPRPSCGERLLCAPRLSPMVPPLKRQLE